MPQRAHVEAICYLQVRECGKPFSRFPLCADLRLISVILDGGVAPIFEKLEFLVTFLQRGLRLFGFPFPPFVVSTRVGRAGRGGIAQCLFSALHHRVLRLRAHSYLKKEYILHVLRLLSSNDLKASLFGHPGSNGEAVLASLQAADTPIHMSNGDHWKNEVMDFVGDILNKTYRDPPRRYIGRAIIAMLLNGRDTFAIDRFF